MTSVTPDLTEQLAQSELLRGLPAAALADLSTRVGAKVFSSGQVLCRAGEEGTSAFLVVRGRFRAEAAGRTVGEIGRGELVGEISLLTGECRSATVVATRSSEVIELPGPVFNAVLAQYPMCYQTVSRRLVQRLQQVLADAAPAPRATVLTLLHDGESESIETLEAFVAVVGAERGLLRTREHDVNRLETTQDLVVLAPEPTDREVVEWAAEQSDRVLLFVGASSQPSSRLGPPTDTPVELVLVHQPSIDCPTGTARWLSIVRPATHHYVRRGDTRDLGRIERRLAGTENILVLSGGGARGLAHAGFYRSLVEQQVPIDRVVGVSSGAVAAAVIGLGVTPEQGGDLATRLFGAGSSPIDLTVPTVAIASGARINQRLKEMYGEHRQLEDLWLPTTVVSANLTTEAVHLHQTGSLWRAVRASTAIPGVFPPVAEPYGLLVDGGIVANLPIDLTRRQHPGATIIASDVGKKMQLLPDDFPQEAEVSGWKAVRSRFGRGDRLPGMVRILAQLTALGGAGDQNCVGDLHVEFDLDGFGMFDFKKAPAIIDAGYRQSSTAVAAWVEGSVSTNDGASAACS